MKIFCLVGLLFILLVVSYSQSVATPKLVIPDPSFNFGYAPQNAKISHKFWLHSTGTDSLKIIKVNPG